MEFTSFKKNTNISIKKNESNLPETEIDEHDENYQDYYHYLNKHPFFSDKLYKGDFENDPYTIIFENKNNNYRKKNDKKIEFFDCIPEEPEEILIFIVHGIGQNDTKLKTILNDRIKKIVSLLCEKEPSKFHFTIHIRMIDWKTPLFEREKNVFDHLVDKNNKSKFPKMFIQNVPLDLMQYMSERNKYKIINDVISQINSYYYLVKKHRSNFKGNVSVIGHSLGSVIMYEILSNMTIDEKHRDLGYNKLYNLGKTFYFKDLFGSDNNYQRIIQTRSKDLNDDEVKYFKEIIKINRKDRKNFFKNFQNQRKEESDKQRDLLNKLSKSGCKEKEQEINSTNFEEEFPSFNHEEIIKNLNPKKLDLKIKRKVKEVVVDLDKLELKNDLYLDTSENEKDIKKGVKFRLLNENYSSDEKENSHINEKDSNIIIGQTDNKNKNENKQEIRQKLDDSKSFNKRINLLDQIRNTEGSRYSQITNLNLMDLKEEKLKKSDKFKRNIFDYKRRLYLKSSKQIFIHYQSIETEKDKEIIKNTETNTSTQDNFSSNYFNNDEIDYHRLFRVYSRHEKILPMIFSIEHFFTIGSPLSLFLTIEHGNNSYLYEMETIKDFHNIIHPMDPVAYRIEHLIYGFEEGETSCLLPHFLNNGVKNLFFRNFLNLIFCNQEKNNEFYCNNKKRYDFMVQESLSEKTVHIIGFLLSHMQYWNNPDVFYFILDIIQKN